MFICFHDDSHDGWTDWEIINLVVDIFFGLDIIVVFFSAFYNDDFMIVD